jgi:hypothetical protein
MYSIVNSDRNGCIVPKMKWLSSCPVFVLMVIASLGYLTPTVMAQKPAIVEAEKLRLEAQNLTDIRSEGSHSFRLTAQIRSVEDKDQAVEGSYELRWQQPTAWREEIKFAGYSQTRIALADKIYITRSAPALPYEVFKFLQMMEFPNLLRLTDEEKIVKLGEHNEKGVHERVIEVVSTRYKDTEKLYFDSSTPIPTRVAMSESSRPLFFFKDFADFHGHLFPHTLSELAPYVKFEIEVRDLADEDYSNSEIAPAPNTSWLHWCPHPEPAKYIAPERPKIYTLPEHPSKFSSAVYGIIGPDGQVHNVAVTKSVTPELDAYWKSELLQDRYIPAKCGDVPVEQEVARYYKYP